MSNLQRGQKPAEEEDDDERLAKETLLAIGNRSLALICRIMLQLNH